jgi:hypothetical protein
MRFGKSADYQKAMPNRKSLELAASLEELAASVEGRERNPRTPSVLRSLFPRSIAGKFQDDPIMRSMLGKIGNRAFSGLSEIEKVELIGKLTTPKLAFSFARSFFLVSPCIASEFFRLVAERLEHLDTYRPTDRDFAIEALQDSFAGFVGSGNSDLLTRGDVVAMAKARLKRECKKEDFSKSSWSDLLKESGLDWPPKKPAGRPKQSLDENQKAEREAKAILTQTVNQRFDGDWTKMTPRMRAAWGTEADVLESEAERWREEGFELDP